MRVNFKFDVKGNREKMKLLSRSINVGTRNILTMMVKDLKFQSFEKKIAPNLEIARKSGKLRSFTEKTTLFRQATLKKLQATLYMKDIQADYLKYTTKEENFNIRLPKRNLVMIPDESYPHRKKAGQPNKHGGIKKDRMFWLTEKNGLPALYRRYGKGRKMEGGLDKNLKRAWFSARSTKYSNKNLDYYGGSLRYLKGKSGHYRNQFIKQIKKDALRRIKNNPADFFSKIF